MTEYQTWVLKRIKYGTAAGPGVTSSALLGRSAQQLFKKIVPELERELTAMVKDGLIVCTSGVWWVR